MAKSVLKERGLKKIRLGIEGKSSIACALTFGEGALLQSSASPSALLLENKGLLLPFLLRLGDGMARGRVALCKELVQLENPIPDL